MRVYTLGKIGYSSETVVSLLLARLTDQDSKVRSLASFALGQFGKTSDSIFPAIIQWIQQRQDSEYVGRGIDVLWYLVVEEETITFV